MTDSTQITNYSKRNFVLVLIIYLLGLFMGALDTGIVTPARTVIQMDLGVSAQDGIWMITIYTLFYAASIPIMGKLADLYGRKYIYLISILLFGIGSLFCGLSNSFDSFAMLIVARAVQALGGGGIMPVATAEFGTSFPPEKRGMALGMVGGVYGIANVFGASAGSAIMDIFGTDHWSYIFFLNVPISIGIVIIGLFTLKNTRTPNTSRLDILGILVLTIMILSFLYGLKSTDFFDLGNSLTSKDVYPFFMAFLVLLPVFILIERKAADPVMNLSYFTDRNITLALIISMCSGVVLMGIVFVPQFAENCLFMETGSGGYLVIILGLFAGVGAPISGKFVDKYSAKAVLIFGFAVSGIGALFLVFVTIAHPCFLTIMIGLVLLGLGLGFTMGTPLNYMMLANTDPKESNSAMATMSLIRSIGTAVAPAIMVGFIAHAGMSAQDVLMDKLPEEINLPKLPYYQEISDKIDEMKNDPDMKDKMGNMDFDIPDMDEMTSMNIKELREDGDSDYELPDDIVDKLQNSDVTTIVANVKLLVERMFDDMVPDVLADISNGINEGIGGIKDGRKELLDAVSEMKEGYDGIGKGITGMKSGVAGMTKAQKQLDSTKSMLKEFANDKFPNNMSLADFIPADAKKKMPAEIVDSLKNIKSRSQVKEQISGIEQGIAQMEAAVKAMEEAPLPEDPDEAAKILAQIEAMKSQIKSMNSAKSQLNNADSMLDQLADGKIPSSMKLTDFMPDSAKKSIPKDTLNKLAKVRSISDLDKMKKDLEASKNKLNKQIKKMEASRAEMKSAMDKMTDSAKEMNTLAEHMTVLDKALPGAFDEAEQNYLLQIDERKTLLEKAFQDTLNGGFRNIYRTVALISLFAVILLMIYSTRREQERDRQKSQGLE